MTAFRTLQTDIQYVITISITVHFYTLSKISLSHTVITDDGGSAAMNPTKRGSSHRVLLVDDDEAVRTMMSLTLEQKGFEVVAAATVTEALKLIMTETFDVLITDLHMPIPSDGFAVITAMRHTQPKALTLLVSGYPDVKSAMDAILLEADDIIVKPFEAGKLAELVHDKLLNRKPAARTERKEWLRYYSVARSPSSQTGQRG